MPEKDTTSVHANTTYRSPYEKASIFSKMHFFWVLPFIKRINSNAKAKLTTNDIPDLGYSESTEKYSAIFEGNYKKYI